VVGRLDDFFAGEIEHAAVKRLQTDADLLLSDGSGHGKGMERVSGVPAAMLRNAWSSWIVEVR
jgi:hypothetical protein